MASQASQAKPLVQILACLLLFTTLFACTTTKPLSLHGINAAPIQPIEKDRYVVAFSNGSKTTVRGNHLRVDDSSVWVYASERGQWLRYDRTQISEISHKEFSTGKTVGLGIGLGLLATAIAATISVLVTPH